MGLHHKDNPQKPKYNIEQAIKFTGVSRVRIHSWVKRGCFWPALPAGGSGRPHLFSFNDLIKLKLLKLLGKYRMIGFYMVAYSEIDGIWKKIHSGPADSDESFIISINIEKMRQKLENLIKGGQIPNGNHKRDPR